MKAYSTSTARIFQCFQQFCITTQIGKVNPLIYGSWSWDWKAVKLRQLSSSVSRTKSENPVQTQTSTTNMSNSADDEEPRLEVNSPTAENNDESIGEFNFGFEDWEYQKDVTQNDQDQKELSNQKQAEEIRKNKELWKEIKSQQLGKAKFPDLKTCFQPVVVDSFNSLRNRPLVDVTAVFRHNAWDNIEWDEDMKAEAEKKIQNNSAIHLTDDMKQILENDASRFWDQFYGIHQNKFFKERNWLFTEFPELESPFGCSVDAELAEISLVSKRQTETFLGENSRFRVLEIGCGNGSTVFPLLAMNNNPELFVYCCDFSSSAVEVVKNNPKLEPSRCWPFTWDVTSDISELPFPSNSLDIIISIFVMSAISPDKFDKVLSNFYKLLKPGGLILFRDYGKYDLVQLRFGEGKCISENFYVRGDGTRVYFFDQDEIEDLFKRNGFAKETTHIDRRLQVNRLKQLKMYRIWLLGKFRKL